MERPEGYGPEDLGPHGPVVFDAGSGEPIAWGFEIRRTLGEDRFNALSRFGSLSCIGGMRRSWVLVTRWLTEAEAVEKYGPVTNMHVGPRGGFQSVTYGKTRFLSKEMRPLDVGIEFISREAPMKREKSVPLHERFKKYR